MSCPKGGAMQHNLNLFFLFFLLIDSSYLRNTAWSYTNHRGWTHTTVWQLKLITVYLWGGKTIRGTRKQRTSRDSSRQLSSNGGRLTAIVTKACSKFFIFLSSSCMQLSQEMCVYLQDRSVSEDIWLCLPDNCGWEKKASSTFIFNPEAVKKISPPANLSFSSPLFPAFVPFLWTFSFSNLSFLLLHLLHLLSTFFYSLWIAPLLPPFLSLSFISFIPECQPFLSVFPPLFFPILPHPPSPPALPPSLLLLHFFSTLLLFDPWLNFHIPEAFL